MGWGSSSRCSNCDDYKEYTFGMGLNSGDIMDYLDRFPLGIHNKILDICLKYDFEETNFSYQLFECSHCDTAHTRLGFKIVYNQGKTYGGDYRCSECRRRLQIASKEIESYKCRKCGLYELKEKPDDYLWD